jgi:F0F1-type ATP synthase membrane subunit c/vacuolar-type H+-ATPase subunit K
MYIFGVCVFVAGFIMPKILLKKYVRDLPSDARNPGFSLSILSAALYQAVALYGLTLGFLSASWIYSLPLFIAAAIGLIITFPTKARWKNRMSNINNESSTEQTSG